MARKPKPHQNPMYGGIDQGDTAPLAVPDLAIAARLLGQPLDQVKDAATRTRPYPHADGTTFYSLHQLTRALGLVESRETREARRRGRAAS
jgi:hypothetical protein